ncbi:glycosyltransferase [Chryseobacterium sp. FH1]|uniref:glycosyltransferase n=1 Tax=Chryseobacterium sp. FH1 TaxID=1233951 RepID=UPI0004E3A1D8|nr:glycosyltransferase [Chryseobacterium sp. FH1]KFC20005.1 hypothetical protein IO90_12380 [Chryseobacterium sp. FH1]
MKLLGIVITYFPDFPEIVSNINSYINDIDTLIVWDNTPNQGNDHHVQKLKNISPKIIILGNGENVGIGSALNVAVKRLLENDYDFLITFDQDSYFKSGMLEKYKEIVLNNSDSTIGVFGVNYTSHDKLAYTNNNDILVVKECITSGSIYPKSSFETGLEFDEDLFIDGIDFDFCYNIYKQSGLQTVILTDVVLNHKIGYSENNLRGKISDNYSAFRTFYLIKNHIYLWRRYSDVYPIRKKVHLIVKYIGLRCISILFFENDKSAKLKSIRKGISQGLSKRIKK